MNLPKQSFIKRFHILGILLIIVLIILGYYSAKICGINLGLFVSNLDQFTVLLGQMANPDWSYFSFLLKPMGETIQMALLGTTIGTIFAVPASFWAAKNIDKNKLLFGGSRLFLDVVRTLPDLLLAAIFVAIIGIGPVTGTLAIAIFSFGMVSKLFSEVIETIDFKPLEAMKAAGASKLQIIRLAVLPQVNGQFISYFLYTLEVNVRSSTVLGYVGAGGIGLYLQQSLDEFNYSDTSSVILMTFGTVLIIDTLSNLLRRKLR